MRPSRAGRSRRPTAQVADARPTPPVLWALVIVVAGMCTFWNSLGAPFIWDDQTAIINNQTIQHLWPLSGPLTPPRETPVAGRPLLNLSFAINYAIDGLTEAGYHAANVAIHICCALLLFGIVRRTLSGPRIPNGFAAASAGSSAAVVALLWLLHPLQTEVIDYVTQRSESLMALFFLATIYCAIRARRSGADGIARRDTPVRNDAGWSILAVVACGCGMASKESMVVAPVVVALYDWAFEFDSLGSAWRARRSLYLGLAATWIVLGALAWSAPRSTVGSTAIIGPWIYLLNQTQMIARYLRLSVWPGALVLDYGLPRVLTLGDVLPAAAVLVTLLTATGVALVRWPRIGFLAAVFFLTLAPTSSVVPILSEVGAERRMYLPLAALATLAVVAGRRALLTLGSATATRRYATIGLTTALLAGLAIRTVARNAEYANPLALWTTTVERFPTGRARMMLATQIIDTGDSARAIPILREAVPDFPDARAALGTELVAQGQIAEGVAVLRQFIAAGPSRVNRIPAHALIAEALTAQQDFDGAAREWRAVVALAPSDPGARAQLVKTLSGQAQAHLRQGDAAGGEPYAREAVQLAPGDAAAHNLLGAMLASTGRFDDAITQFREALRLAPTDPQARNNLDRALQITSTLRLHPHIGESAPR